MAITADCHLRQDRPERGGTLASLLASARDLGAGAVIAAGDLFDAEEADYAVLDTLLDGLGRIPDLIVLPGNHDPHLSGRHFTHGAVRVVEEVERFRPDRGAEILLVPYSAGRTFSDVLGGGCGCDPGAVLVGHGDWITAGRARSNPLEKGFHMPLTPVDLEAGRFAGAVLGHLHTPLDHGPIHIPGSPCPVDHTETGRRSFLLLDTESGSIRRAPSPSMIIHLRASVVVVPSPDEADRAAEEVAQAVASARLGEGERRAARLGIVLRGYARSRADVAGAVAERAAALLGGEAVQVDASGLRDGDDSQRNAVAAEVASGISSMRRAGCWVRGEYAPTGEAVLAKALEMIYGGRA